MNSKIVIAKILEPRNLYKAYRKVLANNGSSGIDRMEVTDLREYLSTHQTRLVREILEGNYVPQAIKGVEIPKRDGKVRLLGIPTVLDRWLQQAVSQHLMRRFELEFSENSYGFRPKKNLHQGLQKSQRYINEGYQDIVDIDLKGFFDEVSHYKLLQLIYDKVKCGTTLRLIRKWLSAPILKGGRLHKRRKGLPQGSPLSPLLSNIMLDQLDKYLESSGLLFMLYADDFSIYCRSKEEARGVGNEMYVYLRDKLCLPINREKSGIRRPTTFEVLGHSFVPIYQRGIKGKYQLVASKRGWSTLKRKLKPVSYTHLTLPTTSRV